MTADELTAAALEAGRKGITWAAWTNEDAVQDFVCSADDAISDAAIKAWEAAHRIGTFEHLAASGWIERWTHAPESFDGFGTLTLEQCGFWNGRALRRVIVDGRHVTWQADRYGSGTYATWETDPRIEERRQAELRERWRAEDATRAAKREVGLAWLKTASSEEILTAEYEDDIERRGLTHVEARDERKRREAEEVERIRVLEIEQALAIVKPGLNLIDDGTPSRCGIYGPIPGRPPTVHYGINEHGYARQTADEIMIRDSAGADIGSLMTIARRLSAGELRVATDGDMLPPEPVLRRVGLDRRAVVQRLEISGHVVWAARLPFTIDVIVLDGRGHIVRSRQIQTAARTMYTWGI